MQTKEKERCKSRADGIRLQQIKYTKHSYIDVIPTKPITSTRRIPDMLCPPTYDIDLLTYLTSFILSLVNPYSLTC